MSIRCRMVHRCLIQRNLSVGLDAYGNVRAPQWGTHVAGQACYYWQPTAREVQGERNVTVGGHALLLPLGVDVTPADRINGVTTRLGYPIAEGPFNITGVIRKPDHLLLTLESTT